MEALPQPVAIQHTITKHKGGAKNRVETRTCYGCHMGDLGPKSFSGNQWKADKDDGQVRRCLCCQRAKGVRSSVLSQEDAVRDAVGEAIQETRAHVAAERAAEALTDEAELLVPPPAKAHVRLASTLDIDDVQAAAYNNLYLDRNPDEWDEERLATALDFRKDIKAFAPLLAIAALPRSSSDKHQGHVLLTTKPAVFWLNAAGEEVGGFQEYGSSQMVAEQSEVNKAQRVYVLSLLPWNNWCHCFPVAALDGWSSSTAWAKSFNALILGKLERRFKKQRVLWLDTYRILYVHLLDQSHAAARFRWHRDTEEDTANMRVKFSVVVLLRKDGTVAGMRMGGATKACRYGAVGLGYVFDAALFHTTEELDDCDCLKVGVFVGAMYE
jgi:hypothetical protein